MRSFYWMVPKADSQNKTNPTMWECMKNCTRNWSFLEVHFAWGHMAWAFWKMYVCTGGLLEGMKENSILHIEAIFRIFRLARFDNDRTISFIPPDGEFELMSYRLNTQVKPLIWIESEIETHSHSRVEIMVKAKSQFKRRSTANNVEIVVPGILNTWLFLYFPNEGKFFTAPLLPSRSLPNA